MKTRGRLALFLALTLLLVLSMGTPNFSAAQGETWQCGDRGVEFDIPPLEWKYDPPITITTFGEAFADVNFKCGESREDNVHLRWVLEKMGIQIKYDWVLTGTYDDFEQKIRLALAAGEPMPDVVTLFNGPLVHELIDSGQFMDVGPLFDEYATGTWKALLSEEMPHAWNPYIRDGIRYAIPNPDNRVVTEPTMWIRRDWLEKLGLEAPTTLEELETVMDAFVNQDPDGNGEKDTYGLGLALKDTYAGGIGDASWIFGAYGTIPAQWNMAADGTVAYGSIQPEAKLALAKIREWMEKGYLHPEAGLHDGNKVAELIASGQLGIVPGNYWLGWWPIPDLVANHPEADLWPYQLPAGPDGRMGRHGTLPSFSAFLINKDMEHPEAFIRYIQYFYDEILDPEFGSPWEYGLHEGYMWATVDGEPTQDRDKIPDGWVDAGKYTLVAPTYPLDPNNEMRANAAVWSDDLSRPFYVTYSNWPTSQHESQKILLASQDIAWVNVFSGAPTQTMVERQEMLDTMEAETFNKIVYGDLPLDAFDQFVQDWLTNGGEAITQEVNDWYMALGS